MAVGSGALLGGLSYFAVGRETTLGTYTTCTSSIEFLNCSLKTTRESKVLEQIANSRTYSKRVLLSKSIEGNIEHYFYPDDTGSCYLLAAAFGSTVTTATATGETAGALANSAIQHSWVIGSMGDTYKGICINMRKGDTGTGEVFEYTGVRVNELAVSCEIDDVLKMNYGLIGINSTNTTNDVSTALTVSSAAPLAFTGGRFSIEATYGSLTSSSFWHVQSVEFTLNNSLKADAESRRLGSEVLGVLPAGIATMELKCSMRFDTTTAFDAMNAATNLSGEFEFTGVTYSGSNLPRTLTFEFPELFIADAPTPEIGGPDEVLTTEVTFQVLRDPSSAGGYACKAIVINQMASV